MNEELRLPPHERRYPPRTRRRIQWLLFVVIVLLYGFSRIFFRDAV